jgi:hypothetical protein
MIKCIRRENLDAFWSREPGTIKGTLDEAKRGLAMDSSLSFAHTLFSPRGPFPVADTMGMGVAIVMLQCSLNPGKYIKGNVQYETVRKFRSAASNIYHSSLEGQQGGTVMAKDTRKVRVTKCPTHSDFFDCFNLGLHKCMGDII